MKPNLKCTAASSWCKVHAARFMLLQMLDKLVGSSYKMAKPTGHAYCYTCHTARAKGHARFSLLLCVLKSSGSVLKTFPMCWRRSMEMPVTGMPGPMDLGAPFCWKKSAEREKPAELPVHMLTSRVQHQFILWPS